MPTAKLAEPHMRLSQPPDAVPSIAITLDACGGATDMRILDTLLNRGVPATIFATGLWLRGNPAAIEVLRAHPSQFDVQNHGDRHLPAVLGSARIFGLAPARTLDAIEREVKTGADAIVAAGFPAPTWYRGATARYSPDALDAIEGWGFRIAGFSINGDAGASLPARTVARRFAAAAPGDVIIAHINQPRRPSGEGVASGIAMLQSRTLGFSLLANARAEPVGC